MSAADHTMSLIAIILVSMVICVGTFVPNCVRCPYRDNSVRMAIGQGYAYGIIFGLFGPLGIIISACLCGFYEYGWCLSATE